MAITRTTRRNRNSGFGSRHFKLEAANHSGAVRFLSGLHVNLEEGKTTSWVTLTRTGKFSDPRYGTFDITKEMLLSMVRNFDARTYGQDIFADVSHRPDLGAAGTFLSLKIEGDRLRALVDWTPYGIEAIKIKGYKYFSVEFHENWQDNEAGQKHGTVLLGAALTVRPVIKGLDPVQLSEAVGDTPTYLHPELQATLLQDIHQMKAKKLAALRAKLEAMKLAGVNVDSLVRAYEKALAESTDEANADILLAEFETLGKQLAEAVGDKPATIQLSMPAGGLTAADVKKLMEDEATRQADVAKKLTEGRDANLKLLADTIGAATGIDEDGKKALTADVSDLITADMSADQVKRLAANQIKHGNELVVAKQLSAMGFARPAGSVHIEVVGGESKKLDGIYREKLKMTSSFAMGKIKLSEKPHPFTLMVLGEFDRLHAAEIHSEVKMLAGETGMTNTSLPVGFQREVLREALSDTNILQLVNTMVDPAATVTTQIPYEQRDVSAVYNDGIVYEGQEIHRAGISQAMDTAYILPTKLAMLISNEAVHFSRASGINWDALGRNLESNARYMRELIARRIANEMQRSADAYGAIAVTGEAFDTQLTGANSIIKTANYPIVRPFQARDLAGSTIGSAENAISITLNGTAISSYDGTGTQAGGTYYRVINYNLGYVQLVSELGVAVTPADTGVNTIGYSKATNIVKVDLDVPGGSTLEKQLNKALQAIGARKAVLSGDRFVTPDFQLMSPSLNDTLTNAEQFVDAGQRIDAAVSAAGDLTTVKGLSAYGTNAPGIDLGDERIIIGQRGVLGYTVAKPFAFGDLFEAVGANGKPIGKKQAYGEEYSAIKVPAPVRDRLTSVLVYSFTGR